jgi:hypothetical protein
MKSSITVPCACGKQIPLEIVGSSLPEYAKCPCGASIYLVEPLGNIVTVLLMERAKQELAHSDVTIAILLSAIAVEGEMAYLFFKWKGMDSGKALANQTQQDRKQWEAEWAEMRSIGIRIEKLCSFLTTEPFDQFARAKKQVLQSALTGYDPGTSIRDFFQERFFEKRNSIAHYGNIDFQKEDGERCFGIASALLALLRAMDERRILAMDEAHRKARELPSRVS